MPKLLRRPLPVIYAIVLVISLSLSTYVWNSSSSSSSSEAFWRALRSSLTVPAVTCQTRETATGLTTEQTLNLDLASGSAITAKTTLRQTNTTVVTEGIGTEDAEYIRYTQIQTNEKSNGKPLDFSAVLNVWGKQPKDDAAAASLYDRTAYGGCVIALADFEDAAADKLITELRQNKVFTTDFAKTSSNGVLWYKTWRYQVTVQPEAYITFMKQAAEAAGSAALDGMTVADYEGRDPEKLTFVIEARTNQLMSIQYADKDRSVHFTYGVKPQLRLPTKTLPLSELQTRLQSIK